YRRRSPPLGVIATERGEDGRRAAVRGLTRAVWSIERQTIGHEQDRRREFSLAHVREQLGGWVDRQGVAPGLRLRRGAVGRGFGCESGRLGINGHRETQKGPWRGAGVEFPRRRPHGAGPPLFAPAGPPDPAHQATIASGAEKQYGVLRSHGSRFIPLTYGQFARLPPVVCLLSAPLARRSHPCRRGGEVRLTQSW